jgi:RNA polymerase sigma factor (sigma-70 family)
MPALNAIPTRHAAAGNAETDVELALSAANGNAMAFQTIVRRNNRLLFRTARGVVPDDAEAQDVVQETYLRAFTSLHSYRGDATLSTWLARIAINVAVTSQRKKGRLVQLQESGNSADQEPVEHAMPLHAQVDESPDAMAERKEVRALLQASIEDLPVIYRSVFILRAVQDLSVEETSYCLGVSEDVVKTRFLRARAMLRDKLAIRVETCAQNTFSFAGARCDAVLAHVMGRLLAQGLIRGQ